MTTAREASPASTPLVSIILPTFNRAQFLPDAFQSIRAQSWNHWELIVVDDGSTDGTEAVVGRCAEGMDQSIKYVRQSNKGAYSARNTGLDHASGEFVAFYDSDDLWLPHYLERCLTAFEMAPDVDWVFAACRSVDTAGTVLQATTFETDNHPRPFLSLKTRTVGDLKVIEDPQAVECHFLHGIYCGLQNSVIRRQVFTGYRFWEDFRVVEDALFLARALLRGIRLAYITDVHVIYRIHEGNSSGSASGASRESLCRIGREHVQGFERLRREVVLNKSQRRAFQRCLAAHYFWDLGFVCCWETNDSAGAFAAFRRGLSLSPLDLRMWKTYLSCRLKSMVRRIVSTTTQTARLG